MKTVLLLTCWTALWCAVVYILATRMRRHVRVYLLIACSALYLAGAFIMFAFIERAAL